MIITNQYFKNDIFNPKAKPSLAATTNSIDIDFLELIKELEWNCLTEILGVPLAEELLTHIDENEADLIKAASPDKWRELVNGKSYVDADGNARVWRGLRFKSAGSSDYNKSLIAYYAYFYIEREMYIDRGSATHQKNKPKNATPVTPTGKVTRAWNNFVDMVEGISQEAKYYLTSLGVAVDYSTQVGYVGLREFIQDMNELTEDTYANYAPKTFYRTNEFGL